MTIETLAPASRSQELADLMELVIAAVKAGEPPDLERLAREHPEHAEELRRALPAIQMLADLSRSHSEQPAMEGIELGELGDYRLLGEIGRGGMGIVYEAEQISLRRRVALKVLPWAGAMDPKRLQRFKNEAVAAASLKHEHIVQVYAVGCERGVHYYAMEFVEGQTLAQLIHDLRPRPEPSAPAVTTASSTAENAPTPLAAALSTKQSGPRSKEFYRRAAELIAQAAGALEHAHSLGVVHRDIKPANLLVDDTGKVYVSDFGLARFGPDAGLTMSGDLLGTLRYMAPEQALAKHDLVDHRADVYGLGATLYELLTGRPAFGGDGREDILRRIAFEEPVAPRKLDKSIPAELEIIVLKALEKNPTDRYATAQALADDLRCYLLHEPIRARRLSPLRRAWKVAHRHPGATVTAAVALLVCLVLGLAGLAVNNRMVRNEQLNTKHALDRAENEQLNTKHALDRAEKQMAVAEAVSDFLRNKLLAQADPTTQAESLRKGAAKSATAKPNPNLTVRELLDRAAGELTPDRIDRQFPGQPLVQAAILKTVGEAYAGIGEYNLAISHLERARDELVRELGAEDLDTVATLESLGRIYFALGRNDELLSLREQLLHVRMSRLGPDHRDTLTSMMHVANSYAIARRLTDALKLHSDTLARRRLALGSEDPDTLQSINNVAICYAKLGRDAESLEFHKEALALRRAKLGDDHPSTLQSLNNVGVAYSNLGQHAEALKCHEEALARRSEALGPKDRDMLKSMNAVAWILANAPDQKLRDPGRALALAKEVVGLASAMGDYWNTLGAANYRASDWKGAVDALTTSRQLRNGGDSYDWFFLALAYGRLGDQEQARKWYDKAVGWMKENKPHDAELRQFRAEAAQLLKIE